MNGSCQGPCSIRSRIKADRGAIEPFVVALFPALIMLAGLAYDVGMIHAARRDAHNVAAAAARAGVNDVDPASIYLGDPILAPTATSTAVAFATDQGFEAKATLLGPTELKVTVTATHSSLLLDLVGIADSTVEGTSAAEIVDGS